MNVFIHGLVVKLELASERPEYLADQIQARGGFRALFGTDFIVILQSYNTCHFS